MSDFSGVRRAVPALLAGLLLLGVIFSHEITAAIGVWAGSTAYNHCFLILPIALWLAWDRRRRLIGLQPRPNWLALIPAAGFALLWIVADRLGVMEGRQLMAMGIVESLFFGVLGWPIYRAMIAPLLYLYFLIPFGGFLTPALQSFTTKFTAFGLNLLDIPNLVTGNTIEISAGVFYIAQACAGLRFLIAAIAFSVLYALLIFRSPWRRLLFIGLSLFVPVIANGFRALGIVWLGHALGSAKAAATDHVLYGYIFFSIVLGLLILLGLPFRQDQNPQTATHRVDARPAVPLWGLLLPMLAVVLLGASGPLLIARTNSAAAAETLYPPPALAGCTLSSTRTLASVRRQGGIMQRLKCDGGSIRTVLVFLPPQSDPGTVFDARRHLSGQDLNEADVSSLHLPGPGLRDWQMVVAGKQPRMTLSALFIDGHPAAGNLMTRIHEAWHSVAGGGYAQLAIIVSAQGGGQETELRLARFIRKEDFTTPALARLTRGVVTQAPETASNSAG